MPNDTPKDGSRNFILVFTSNADGEMLTGVAVEIIDRFTPGNPPKNVTFVDNDFDKNQIAGEVVVTAPDSIEGITDYRVYWGKSANEKLTDFPFPVDLVPDKDGKISHSIAQDTNIPSSAKFLLVYSRNGDLESATPYATPIKDVESLIQDIKQVQELAKQLAPTAQAEYFWISAGFQQTTFGTPPDSTSDDVKIYSNAIPTRIDGKDASNDGFFVTLGFKFDEVNSVAYSLGRSRVFKIDKQIDVEQTPADTSDDVTVRNGEFSYNVISYFYFPHPWAFIGAGLFNGTMNFEQETQPTTKRIAFSEEILYVGTLIPIFSDESPWLFSFTMSFDIPGRSESIVENNIMLGLGYKYVNPLK